MLSLDACRENVCHQLTNDALDRSRRQDSMLRDDLPAPLSAFCPGQVSLELLNLTFAQYTSKYANGAESKYASIAT